MQATEHQTKALRDRKHTRAVCYHELQVETELPEWLQPFTEGLTRGPSSSTDVLSSWRGHTTSSNSLLARILQQHPLQTTHEESTMYSIIFPKTRICEVCRRTKVTRASCQRNPDDRADRMKIAERFGDMTTAGHRFLMKSKSRDCVANMQWLCRTWGTQWIKVVHAKPRQLRRRREVFEHSYVQKKTEDPLIRTILWHLLKLAKS